MPQPLVSVKPAIVVNQKNWQQNGSIEKYNWTVRYDWLSQYMFDAIAEVQDYATRWPWIYNNERPSMALNGITPKQKLAMAQYKSTSGNC